MRWDRRRGNRHQLECEQSCPDIRGKNGHEDGQTLEPDPGERVMSVVDAGESPEHLAFSGRLDYGPPEVPSHLRGSAPQLTTLT